MSVLWHFSSSGARKMTYNGFFLFVLLPIILLLCVDQIISANIIESKDLLVGGGTVTVT